MSNAFTVVNEINAALPRVSFRALKDGVLGTKYNLSLIIASPKKMKQLNTIYRDKQKATDILSFPLSETEGEIYLSPSEAKKESKKFDRTYENFLAFLFIHGCVHLKGIDHGATMERIEAKFRQKFNV